VQAFIRDRRIERREVDRPHRLSAEYERVVSQALAVNLRFRRELTKAVETAFGLLLDAAIKQTNGREIARVLYSLPQGQSGLSRARLEISNFSIHRDAGHVVRVAPRVTIKLFKDPMMRRYRASKSTSAARNRSPSLDVENE
jgi:hypothetical protein